MFSCQERRRAICFIFEKEGTSLFELYSKNGPVKLSLSTASRVLDELEDMRILRVRNKVLPIEKRGAPALIYSLSWVSEKASEEATKRFQELKQVRRVERERLQREKETIAKREEERLQRKAEIEAVKREEDLYQRYLSKGRPLIFKLFRNWLTDEQGLDFTAAKRLAEKLIASGRLKP